jgi:hypothetical protein
MESMPEPSPLAATAKRAYLMHQHLLQLRENAQHISTLEGIRSFVEMFNRTSDECRELLAADPAILESISFLNPVHPDTTSSDYASAIIDGKRGQFMVNSSVLLSALASFVKFHLPAEEQTRLGVA